ncbi:NACHT domain-containing protein [Micromonospora chersina]
MARSNLTYAAAVRLLAEGDARISTLDRLLGGAIFATAPVTGGASLALVDPKNEAIKLLRDLTGSAPGRIKASTGKRHYELVEAAHTVLILSSFFDAFAAAVGPAYDRIGVTDEDKLRMGGLDQQVMVSPGALRGRVATEEAVADQFRVLYQHAAEFIRGFAATEQVPLPPPRKLVDDALVIYRERYARLAVDIPEIGFWAQSEEHITTQALVVSQTDALTRLADMLERITDSKGREDDVGQRLSKVAAAALQKPLWRIGHKVPSGITFPTVEQGFISPRFRLAIANGIVKAADDAWWKPHALQKDLSGFLARYLTDPDSARQPLVLLGHPGAGKSLLTEVLAARLPAQSFTTVRVPLRKVQADAPIHRQVEASIDLALREETSWRDLCRATRNTVVLLLDGFDELVQATGVAQSDYLLQVADLQEQEWASGQPVLAIVTSRTLVMDRTRIPDGTVLVRLEPFDDTQVSRWAETWNRANPTAPPLSADELLRHDALARQPLLLLMLAVYSHEEGSLGDEDLSRAELYRRLLDTFILRQVRDKAHKDIGDPAFEALQARQRHDLAIAAFGMFNRGQQHISENDLGSDLDVLRPDQETYAAAGHGEPITRAKRTIAAFFFVHVAQADGYDDAGGRRTYEFLHATFGEYLIAERTVEVLANLAKARKVIREVNSSAAVDDPTLRKLLSYQPLTKGESITDFCIQLLGALDEEVRTEIRRTALDLLRSARQQDAVSDRYNPVRFDAVNRLAAYTANIFLVALLSDLKDGIQAHDIPAWSSTVSLWRAGLDPEAQKSLFARLAPSGNAIRFSDADPVLIGWREAELVGDTTTAAVVEAGMAAWNLAREATSFEVTEFQKSFHVALVYSALHRDPLPQHERMRPFDERAYERLSSMLEGNDEPVSYMSAQLLLSLLISDALQLPDSLVERLVRRLLATSRVEIDLLITLFQQRRHLLSLTELPWDAHVWSPAKTLDIARRADAEVQSHFASRLNGISLTDPTLGWATVAPSMVTTLRDHPHLLPEILTTLADFGTIAWEQIRPVDLISAIRAADDSREYLLKPVAQYLKARRGSSLDEIDAKAMRELELWAIQEANDTAPWNEGRRSG